MSRIVHQLVIYHKGNINTINLSSLHRELISIGRNSDNDIIIKSSIVSGRHAVIKLEGEIARIFDSNSTNGIMINGKKTNAETLRTGDILRVDNLDSPLKEGVLMFYFFEIENSHEHWESHDFNTINELTIGRDASCEINIDSDAVSLIHARVYHDKGNVLIEDMDSENGTFVNGKLIDKPQILKGNDVIYIGSTKFIFNNEKFYYNSISDGVRIEVVRLTKCVKSSGILQKAGKEKTILDGIEFNIKPGDLVSIAGPSGSGKSTLLSILAGVMNPTGGEVFINGDHFHEHYGAYKDMIGYVPNEDFLFDGLTVRQMLYYSAKLRMPLGTLEDEIIHKIEQIMVEMGLEDAGNTLIKNVSFGQKKRVEIAVILISDPKILLLDEPTSGLDPDMEMHILFILKKLALVGKTVVFTTHSIQSFHVCKKMLFIGVGGKQCYFGDSSKIKEFFGVENEAEIYPLITDNPSEWNKKHVKLKNISIDNKRDIKWEEMDYPKMSFRIMIKQMKVLFLRNVRLLLNEKLKIVFLLFQAPLIALLVGLVVDQNTIKYRENIKQFIFILVCSSIWIGVLNSIQEIAKERNIILHEKAGNLNVLSYLVSKMTIYTIFALIQGILLIGTLSIFVDFPKGYLVTFTNIEVVFSLVLIIIASASMGLFFSSFFRKHERALVIMPIVLIFQILFSGQVFKLDYLSNVISNFSMSKWGINTLGTVLNLNSLSFMSPLILKKDEIEFTYLVSNIVQYWGVMILFSVVFTLLTMVKLKFYYKNSDF